MTIEVIARHKKISDFFRDYAQKRGEKLGEKFPMVEHVSIVLDFQNNYCSAEVIAQRKDEKFVAKVESDISIRSATDSAAAKVERQIRRKRQMTSQVPVRKSALAAEAAK